MKFITFLSLLLILLCGPVWAADDPIEITADDSLEWDRAQKTVTATGNALITQADSSIAAPSIIADYDDRGDEMMVKNITAAPNAVFKRPSETLTARELKADFNQGVLATVTAMDNVVLKTNTETLYGSLAVYNAQKRTIIVTGDVRIEQDNNILYGSRAEFDLNTNISRLMNDTPQGNGRVRAVFGGGQ